MDLSAQIEFLKVEIKSLREENAFLRRKVSELEDKLNINSSNSGLPTSKEIYKKEKKNHLKSNKRPGGQFGHKHNSYILMKPDEIVSVFPKEKVCVCGMALDLSLDVEVCQKAEIPEIKPHVTEYHLHKRVCPKCKKRYKGKLKNYKLLGPNAETILSVLTGVYNNSKRDVQSILQNVFGLKISLGLVSKSEERASEKLESSYNELVLKAKDSKLLHMDETSHSNKGARSWCWVACSKSVTIFKLIKSRGRKVLDQWLGDYSGKVVSDRYAVYNKFSSGKRQICLAHIRRDCKRLAHSSDEATSNLGKNLLQIMDNVFSVYHCYMRKDIKKKHFLKRMKKLQKGMKYYLRRIELFSASEHACRVAKNLLKSFDMMWLFVNDGNIEPTNNFAERQIKHHVKYRKNSLFTWSERGDRFLERIKSIWLSSKANDENPFEVLKSKIYS